MTPQRSPQHLKVQGRCCLCVSSHADTLIVLPVSVERPALPLGKAEVSFLTLAASAEANYCSRQTDGQTDGQSVRRAKGGSSLSTVM